MMAELKKKLSFAYLKDFFLKPDNGSKSLKPLFFFGLLFEVFYIALGFLQIYKEHLGDMYIPTINGTIRILFVAWSMLIFMVFLYLLFGSFHKEHFGIIIGFFFIFSITLAIIWPLGSSDIFNYIYRARVFTEYGENPFIVPPSNYPNDIMETFIIWKRVADFPIIYGPLWGMISFIPNFVFGDNVQFIILGFKVIAIFFTFGSAYIIYKILEVIHPSSRYFGLLAFAWNPHILYEYAQNGHNDIITVFFILLAIYLLVKKKYTYVLVALALSFMIKFQSAILFIPFLIYLWNSMEKNKIKILSKSLVISAGIIAIFYTPFWNGSVIPTAAKGVLNPPNLMFSFFPLISTAILKIDPKIANITGAFLFIAIYLFLISKLSHSSSIFYFLKYCMWIYVFFYIFFLPWIMPWYFSIPIVFSILIPEKFYKLFGAYVLFLALLGYVILYILIVIIFTPFLAGIYWVFFRLLKSMRKDQSLSPR